MEISKHFVLACSDYRKPNLTAIIQSNAAPANTSITLCTVLCPGQALDILADYASGRFGAPAFEHVDATTPAAARFIATNRFREGTPAPGATDAPFLFLLAAQSSGLGTDLPNIDYVIVYESDWHPRLDVSALRRAHRLGGSSGAGGLRSGSSGSGGAASSGGPPLVLRLYARGSVEERLLQVTFVSMPYISNISSCTSTCCGQSWRMLRRRCCACQVYHKVLLLLPPVLHTTIAVVIRHTTCCRNTPYSYQPLAVAGVGAAAAAARGSATAGTRPQ